EQRRPQPPREDSSQVSVDGSQHATQCCCVEYGPYGGGDHRRCILLFTQELPRARGDPLGWSLGQKASIDLRPEPFDEAPTGGGAQQSKDEWFDWVEREHGSCSCRPRAADADGRAPELAHAFSQCGRDWVR